jgi:hypothetical protein
MCVRKYQIYFSCTCWTCPSLQARSLRQQLLVSWLVCCYKKYLNFSMFFHLKANRNQIWQASWSIYDFIHSLQSKRKVRKWKHGIWYYAYSPLGNKIPTWSAPARVFPPQEGRAWERGWHCRSFVASISFPESAILGKEREALG